MSKKCKRKARKAESLRRKNDRRRKTAQTLAAGAVIAAGTQAYATPIRFDNPAHGQPGHHRWRSGDFPDNALNITLDALSQPGDSLGSTPGVFFHGDLNNGVYSYASGNPGNELLHDGTYYLLDPLGAGQSISGAGTSWFGFALIVAEYGPPYTLIPEGQNVYLGTRFDPGDGFHYGWIGVNRIATGLQAFAWGYETDPGVPIAAGAPEPGSLALLAFGAAGVAGTHRRRRDGD
ncbi:MAG: PEP-CTERM sorting domain-containing protein [Phycisphaerales bacterium]|nr:PEP-CTERM sorting domain-containing protein [Phycisphaerales bacterium]